MIPTVTTETAVMRSIHRYIWGKLFHPGTNLFYDYLTDREPSRRFRHLPSIAEIARQFPNPCGWSTGMEDCMLNAGSVMDILRLRHKCGEDNLGQALSVLDGIYRCTTVHGRNGFVVRGISPRDGRSCYSNSSRDQFTLAVYGVWRFLEAYPEAPVPFRERAREILHMVAEFCRTRGIAGVHYDLGRLDGGPAIVSKLWNCAPHEMLRLPMFYGAAFLATGDGKFRRLMEEFAEPGLEATLRMDPAAHWWDIPLAQMLLSLRFFEETQLCPELAGKLAEAQRRGVALARRDLLKKLAEAEAYRGEWEVLNTNWRRLPMVLRTETLSEEECESDFGGCSYLNPCFPPEFNRPNSFLRAFGNDLVAMLYGGEVPTAEERRRLAVLIGRVDFFRCGGSGPIQLFHALQLAENFGVELAQTGDSCHINR